MLSKPKMIKKIKIIFLGVFIMLSFSNESKANNYRENSTLICIDPGHQARGNSELEEQAPGSSIKKAKVSSGTRGVVTKKNEYELTLDVGLKLRNLLKSKGYKTFMIRETHNVNISNKERALITNKMGCAVYIRIHADGSENRTVNGVSVLTSSAKNRYTGKVQKESDRLSKNVLEEVIKTTGAKNRGVSYRDDLTGTNWSTSVNTLLEMGFMSNPEEDRKMASDDYQNKIVLGIFNGIEKYLEKR